MKHIFLNILLLILVISCVSDDKEEILSLNEKILVGSWNFQRHGETCSNGFNLDEGGAYQFIFLKDNTVSFNIPGYLTSSYYELTENILILETIYTLPSGSKRKFVGNYIFSEVDESFKGSNTFTAYNDTETLWTCEGTTSIFK